MARIAIDGRTIVRQTSGIGQYAEHLVRSLLKIDRENQYVLFLIEPNEIEAPNLTKVMIVGYDRRILNRWWENFLLPGYIRKFDIDLYFSPAYALPFLPRMRKLAKHLPLPRRLKNFCNAGKRVRYVVTIHDMISYIHPEYFTPKMRMWQHLFVTNAVRVADTVLTVSQRTRQDILRYFPIDDGRIEVITPWFDEKFRPVTDSGLLREAREKYSLPQNYILYLGTIEPRKNIKGLIEAYGKLPETLREKYTLVLGGGLGWYADGIVRAMRDFPTILHLNYVEHKYLTALYTMAGLFVFPSFYEGFGSPPLEAMSCGVPVITSGTSALPEVVGDAALTVDPNDVAGLAEAMRRVLTDTALAERLRAAGLERAKLFHWRKNAEEVLAVFNRSVRG